MKIGVLGDTHIPRRANEIPKEVLEQLKKCDLIIHTGDFSEISVLEQLKKLGPPVKAVYGNMDSHELMSALPEKIVFNAGKFKIGVYHGDGPSFEMEERAIRRFNEKLDVLIFGHSHQPKNEVINGVLLFNTGSPTDTFFAPYKSFGILTINEEVRGEIIKI